MISSFFWVSLTFPLCQNPDGNYPVGHSMVPEDTIEIRGYFFKIFFPKGYMCLPEIITPDFHYMICAITHINSTDLLTFHHKCHNGK